MQRIYICLYLRVIYIARMFLKILLCYNITKHFLIITNIANRNLHFRPHYTKRKAVKWSLCVHNEIKKTTSDVRDSLSSWYRNMSQHQLSRSDEDRELRISMAAHFCWQSTWWWYFCEVSLAKKKSHFFQLYKFTNQYQSSR